MFYRAPPILASQPLESFLEHNVSNDITRLHPQPPFATATESRPASPVTTASPSTVTNSDTVTVTSAAEMRLEMEKALNSMEPTDPQRIAEVREALANGTFQIDAESIARHLLEMEKELY